jgi:hypothetical protein
MVDDTAHVRGVSGRFGERHGVFPDMYYGLTTIVVFDP